jgi:hypothetical protein
VFKDGAEEGYEVDNGAGIELFCLLDDEMASARVDVDAIAGKLDVEGVGGWMDPVNGSGSKC